MNIDAIGKRCLLGEDVSVEEAEFLARACALEDLMSWTDKIRERFFDRSVQICAVINARSNACSEDCRFCAQSSYYNTVVDTYSLLDSDKIVQAAREASVSIAASFGIVTSGLSVGTQTLETIVHVINDIFSETGLRSCASLGKLNEEQLNFLKKGGLRYYHHNLETSRAFFPSVCSTHTWDERVATVCAAKAVGLRVCSGGLFGMGETWDDRISLGFQLREMEVDSVPINFLHPIPGTPFENREPISSEEGLRIIALYRFILPKTTVRVCGGRVLTLGNRQNEMFRAGANGMMTGNYLTTVGSDRASDNSMLKKLRMTPASICEDNPVRLCTILRKALIQ